MKKITLDSIKPFILMYSEKSELPLDRLLQFIEEDKLSWREVQCEYYMMERIDFWIELI
jgi:hypothetical protein